MQATTAKKSKLPKTDLTLRRPFRVNEGLVLNQSKKCKQALSLAAYGDRYES